MCRSARLSCLGFTCLGLFVTVSVQAAELPPPDLSGKVQHAFCFTSHNEYREPAVYLSDVFEIRVPQNAGIWYPRDMAKVFIAYLKQQHGYVETHNPTVFCSLHDTAQMAQPTKDQMEKLHRQYKQDIVETGWRMTAAQAEAAVARAPAPSPAAAATPSAAPIIHGYCIGNVGPKAYFSAVYSAPREVPPVPDVFDKNRPTGELWEKSFTDYLAQEHAVQAKARCFTFEGLSGAQLNWQRQLTIASAFGPAKFAETGWTYQSAQ